MNYRTILPLVGLMMLFALSCSGDGTPVAPDSSDDLTSGADALINQAQTNLWGYYDVYIDAESQRVEAVLNRNVMFAANVVDFINGNPANLKFMVNGIFTGSNYLDVDIDVSITHPLPGYQQYDGYDVMGILDFVSDTGWNNFGDTNFNALIDHSMRDDPFNKDSGGPDGYTRWYNATEFTTPEMFGYTQGMFATDGFSPSATLRPYRYYADGLGSHTDLWTFLNNHPDDNGVFSSGSTNTRNYYIRFQTPNPGVKYAYTIVGRWNGEYPADHPANAQEAVACSITVTDDIYYVDPTDNGGDLILDISVFDWASEIEPGGVMEDYIIKVESTVLSSAHSFNTSEMTPTDGGELVSTYHVEIPADNIQGTQDNELWVIVEYADYDYKNEYGVSNLANDPLAAFFRQDLYISGGAFNLDPVCDMVVVTLMPIEGWAPIEVEFNALGSYDPEGNPLSFEWDFNDDGTFGDSYDSGTDGNPTKEFNAPYTGDVCVKVSDDVGGESICCAPVDIESHPIKNITLRSGVVAYDLAVAHANGDLLVLYSDGQVWKYNEGNYYDSGSHLYTTNTGYNRIEISPNGSSIVGGPTGGTDYARSYNSGGSHLAVHTGHYDPCGPYGCVEVFGYVSGWQHNKHGAFMGYDPGFCQNALVTWMDPGYDTEWTFNYVPPGYLATRLVIDLVRGCEACDYENTYMFFVEAGPEYSVERYNQINLNFAGVAWGGTQTDDMDGFNDPHDITRDNNNDYYILDWLSNGEPQVKKYTEMGVPIGLFGNSLTIFGDPRRIEGSDYNGNIFVLHSYGLSIFLSAKIPQ